MGLRVRYFVAEPDGPIRRVARSRYQRWFSKDEALPANRVGSELRFLEVGKLDASAAMQLAVKRLDLLGPSFGADAQALIEQLEADVNYFWLPTDRELEGLGTALLKRRPGPAELAELRAREDTRMGDVSVRPATPDDAAAICTIYNQGIEDRVATLETLLRTPEERRQWLAGRGPRHPVVVATTDGQVVGWSSLNRFNARPAYDHVVDLSVYVERGWRGRGVGKALLPHVLGLARQIGYHKMVLATFPYNDAGLALYRRMGFAPVGVYHEQGQLDGRWVDVLIMEQLL